jgi:hypothetical protein
LGDLFGEYDRNIVAGKPLGVYIAAGNIAKIEGEEAATQAGCFLTGSIY